MSGLTAPAAAPLPANLAQTLDRQAAHRPDKRAFVFLERGERETDSITYAELALRARLIANRLRERDLTGRRVILAYPTCIEFIAALFGCFHAGVTAIPAPIDSPGRGFPRLRGIAADASAAAVLSLRSGLEAVAAGIGGSMEANPLLLATDEFGPAAESGPPTATGPTPSADPDAVALLQYTSGSTGNPRGVMLTHGNLLHQQLALQGILSSGPEDIGVNWLPLYHDMGLIGGVLHAIYLGGFSALMPPLSFVQRPLRWLQAIDRYRVSISMGPAFAYGLAAQQSRRQSTPLDLSCWRTAICGGEPIRPEILEQFSSTFESSGFDPRSLMPAYGLAESTLMATASRIGVVRSRPPTPAAGEVWSRSLVSCGQAVDHARVAIVDPESRCRSAPGRIGEIWLQGPSVAAGYWQRPEDTDAAFHAALADDPGAGTWLRTGDLGYLEANGLVVTGRAKDLIVIRGANFDPIDIETAAGESDSALAVGGAAAFSIQTEDSEAAVLLYEVNRDAAALIDIPTTAGRVIDAVSRNLGLTLFDLVLLHPRTLPRTTSGKIQRHMSREQYLAGRLASLGSIDHPGLGRLRPRPSA